MNWKRSFGELLWLVMVALTAPICLSAQQVADTLTVTVEGDLAVAEIVYEGTPRIGDTIQFVGEAYDSEGDPVTATLTWATSDSTIMSIDASSGEAVVHAKGTVSIYLLAELVQSLALGAFRPEDGPTTITFPDPPHWDLHEGESLQMCGYLLSPEGLLVAQSAGSPGSLCPGAFPVPNYTSGLLALFDPVRIRAWGELQELAGRLLLDRDTDS